MATRLNVIRVIFLGLAFFSFCANPEKKEIKDLLKLYQESVNNGSAIKFLSCLERAPGFLGTSQELAEQRIKSELSQDLKPNLKIISQELKLNSKTAMVNQEFLLEGIIFSKSRRYQEKEELVLEKTASGWKIVSGSVVYMILAGRALEEDAIKDVLKKRVEALRDKDLERFKEIVIAEYDFQGKNYDAIISEMRTNFQDYEKIELELDPPKIKFYGDKAEVVEGFQLKAIYKGETLEFKDKERLEFTRSNQGWKISKGL